MPGRLEGEVGRGQVELGVESGVESGAFRPEESRRR